LFAIKSGRANAFFARRTMAKIVEKLPVLHNVYLRNFWLKNTISCGGFDLPAKHIVAANIPAGSDLTASKGHKGSRLEALKSFASAVFFAAIFCFSPLAVHGFILRRCNFIATGFSRR
jgi:hypothetical protein